MYKIGKYLKKKLDLARFELGGVYIYRKGGCTPTEGGVYVYQCPKDIEIFVAIHDLEDAPTLDFAGLHVLEDLQIK